MRRAGDPNPDPNPEQVLYLKDRASRTPWHERQLKTEAKLWAQLAHPNIAQFYGSVTVDGWVLLFAEALTGGEG